jgi:hypothetical protein
MSMSLQAQPLLDGEAEPGDSGDKKPAISTTVDQRRKDSLRPDPELDCLDSPFFGSRQLADRRKGTKHSWRRWWWGVVHVYASNHWHPLKHDYGRQTHYWPAKIFEVIVGFFIMLNVVTSIMDTAIWESSLPSSYEAWDHFVMISELISTIFFAFEYTIRVWACVEEPKYRDKGALWGRLRWAIKPLALIDFLNVVVFSVDLTMIYAIKQFESASQMHENSGTKDILKIFRMFRIGAILRFERRVKGIHRIAYILRDVYAGKSPAGTLDLLIFKICLYMQSCGWRCTSSQ